MTSNKDIETNILRLLGYFNRWWTQDKISGVPPFKRMDFFVLQKNMKRPEIVVIGGARQVGKSTLMAQTIENLLTGGVPPKRVLFFEADNNQLNILSKNIIADCLNVYQTYILKEELNKVDDTVYVFIDEVQKIHDWPQQLKDWFGLNKNIKFIVSGSSNTRILKDCNKILVGRYAEQMVVPFTFVETARYFCHKNDNQDLKMALEAAKGAAREALSAILNVPKPKQNDIHKFYDSIANINNELAIYKPLLQRLLNEYFVRGGYPRVVTETDAKYQREHLSTITRGVIDTDLTETYGLRKEDFMRNLLVILAHQSSQLMDIETIKKTLNEKSSITITKYMSLLENGLLISLSSNAKFGVRGRIRKLIKKVYINDVGMRNNLVNFLDDSIITDNEQMGLLAETVAFNHCVRLQYNITGVKSNVFYWRGGNKEVDVVLTYKDKMLPIEVKYRNKIDADDFSGINSFFKEEKKTAGFGIIISKDTLTLSNNVVVMPLMLFLLIC